MANLLGQLGLPPNPQVALSLLAHAAGAATPDYPQPAYVYGMLLAGEFEGASVPTSLLLPASSTSPALERQHAQARQHIETAAYLCFPPAQYKLGCLYEHATLGCPYDPLMSVQWYSLASQAGDFEADMALSKWFLCGAEGCFAKNEELARTFAVKAANAGLGTGCFALGYYNE
jgi:TPR repeat protein